MAVVIKIPIEKSLNKNRRAVVALFESQWFPGFIGQIDDNLVAFRERERDS